MVAGAISVRDPRQTGAAFTTALLLPASNAASGDAPEINLLILLLNLVVAQGLEPWISLMSGKLRALGTSVARRTALINDIPPIADTVPHFDLSGWMGVAGPGGMPHPVVARIAERIA